MLKQATLLECMVYSKSGKREFYSKKEIDSFLRQYIEWLYNNASYSTSPQKRDITNTLRNPTLNTFYYFFSSVGSTGIGIVVGTSSQAVSISDYKLITQIAHGSGAGQLYHQASTLSPPEIAGNISRFVASRNFNNNSGGDITIQEVGLYSYDPMNSWSFCFARDLTGGHLVQNGKTYVAQYTFLTTT